MSSPAVRGARALDGTEPAPVTPLAPFAEQWRRLEQRGGAATPYRTLSWASAWWRCFAGPATPLVIELPEADTLAPFSCRRLAGLRVIEPLGTGISDYPGLVSLRPESEAWPLVLSGLAARRREWDLLRFDAVSDPEPMRAAMRARLGAEPAVRVYEECPLVDTRQSFESLLAAGGRNLRKAVKRDRRRVEEQGTFVIAKARPPFAAAAIEELREVERASWKWERGDASFRDPRQDAFLTALLGDADAPLELWTLRFDGALAAFAIVLTGARRWHFYLSTYREDRPHSGAFLLNQIIEAACADPECDTLDLLRGKFEYKTAWTERSQLLYEMICPSGIAGRALVAAYRLRWRAARSERIRAWRSRWLRIGDRRGG